jgi:peptidase, U32 family
MRTIELLAPAKNLACGIAAIDHGADAVYIGASRFGARQSAGNSVEDIHELCEYAHRFGATVHVTINTIIYDSELEETIALVRELVEAGVDAFLLQDMGLMSEVKKIVPETVALHASTQCDTRTWEKASWLSQQGFDRVVLARELSSEEISGIHKHLPDLELEAFVHGALCVSYSGICYASQYCFGRSANRGACAQFCRLAFDLKDSDGKTIEHQKHLLSLKDMSQIDNLETLMRSGACAFKIEGRLKDINYVKNVVSAYSQRINEIIGKYPKEFCRASLGRVQYTFTPDLKKTFNRGYTNYFLNGRQPDIFSPDTPKALGEYVGRVKEIRRDSFNVAGTATFANGDGLCFLEGGQVGENSSGQVESGRNSINPSTVLQGFRVNRAVGNRLYPFKMPKGLKPGMALYRNQDQSFDKELSGTTAVRKIPIGMRFGLTNDGFKVDANITSLDQRRTAITFAHQLAQKPQHDNIVRQLSKLGNTVYECSEIDIEDGVDSYFIPSSILAELRRKVVEQLDTQVQQMKRVVTHRQTNDKGQGIRKRQQFSLVNPSQYNELPYLYNISNDAARKFYEYQGLSKSESAFECQQSNGVRQGGEADLLLMQCRHCIRYSLGYCVKRGGKNPKWHEPLYLELSDKRRFRLEFDCKNCQMNVLPE